jgi:hypothetical protein
MRSDHEMSVRPPPDRRRPTPADRHRPTPPDRRRLTPADRHGPTPPDRRPPVALIRHARAAHGQAAVELVALLPIIAALLAALWQAALAGHAAWAASAAARAAARAHAVGSDPRQAARDHLPASLERGLRLEAADDGEVELTVHIPTLPGMPDLGRAGATARFAPQS